MIKTLKVSGVYKITNIITGDFYIGTSVNIRMRYSTHIGRDARKYYHKHKFYKDMIDYGKDNFKIEVLKECSRDDLLEWEQYYYDTLSPTYNKVRPAENNFMHKEVLELAQLNSQTKELIDKRRELYNTDEYKELFRNCHTEKMKPVEMILNDVVVKEFISMQEASRYISDITDFKGKNKTSKIKAVCDGERKSAYGYNWKYSKV